MGKTVAKALNDIFEKAKGVLNHFQRHSGKLLRNMRESRKEDGGSCSRWISFVMV